MHLWHDTTRSAHALSPTQASVAKQAKARLSLRQLCGAAERDEQHVRVLRDVPGLSELGRLLPHSGLADALLLRSKATLPRGDGTKQQLWSDYRISDPPRQNCRYPFFIEVCDFDESIGAASTHYGQVCSWLWGKARAA